MRDRAAARALLLVTMLGACSPAALSLAPDHPARPSAPAGRLAGPPAALRPGIADASSKPPPASTDGADAHEGHGSHDGGSATDKASPP